MQCPLLAAALAVAFLLAAPMVGRALAKTFDAANITAPLACAMAHSGPCQFKGPLIQMAASAG